MAYTEFGDLLGKFRNNDKEPPLDTIKIACESFKNCEKKEELKKFCQASYLVYKAFFQMEHDREIISNCMIENLFLKNISDNLEKVQNASIEKGLADDSYHLLNIFYTILVNYSFENVKFSESVLDSKIMTKLQKNIDVEMLEDIENDRKFGIVYDSLCIIFNVVQCVGKNHDSLKKIMSNISELLSKLNNDKCDKAHKLNLICCSILFMCDYEKIEQIKLNDARINTLMDYIEKARRRPTYNGFYLRELLDVLKKMSVYKSVVNQLIQKDIVINVLEDKFIKQSDLKYKSDVVEILINFVYYKVNRDSLRDKLKNIVNELNDEESKEMLVKNLNREEDQRRVMVDHKYKFDIFLSYCHANKGIVHRILEELKYNNFKVWVDVEQIKNKSGDDMKNGIEDSYTFVSAISNGYQKSENCKKELKYALSIKKPLTVLNVESGYRPKDWLSFELGDTNYIKLALWDIKSFDRLTDEINEKISK